MNILANQLRYSRFLFSRFGTSVLVKSSETNHRLHHGDLFGCKPSGWRGGMAQLEFCRSMPLSMPFHFRNNVLLEIYHDSLPDHPFPTSSHSLLLWLHTDQWPNNVWLAKSCGRRVAQESHKTFPEYSWTDLVPVLFSVPWRCRMNFCPRECLGDGWEGFTTGLVIMVNDAWHHEPMVGDGRLRFMIGWYWSRMMANNMADNVVDDGRE